LLERSFQSTKIQCKPTQRKHAARSPQGAAYVLLMPVNWLYTCFDEDDNQISNFLLPGVPSP